MSDPKKPPLSSSIVAGEPDIVPKPKVDTAKAVEDIGGMAGEAIGKKVGGETGAQIGKAVGQAVGGILGGDKASIPEGFDLTNGGFTGKGMPVGTGGFAGPLSEVPGGLGGAGGGFAGPLSGSGGGLPGKIYNDGSWGSGSAPSGSGMGGQDAGEGENSGGGGGAGRPPDANVSWFTFKAQSGDFGVYSFNGFESVCKPYEFTIELVSRSANEDIVSLLGTPALLSIIDRSGGTRLVHGLIRNMLQLHSANRFTHYVCTLVPRLWFLDQIRDHRIFQELSVKDIIEKILKEQGFAGEDYAFKLDKSYEPREYCVQYGETDLHFITRLCEEEGIYFYFEHKEESHCLCFCDREGGPKIAGNPSIRFFPGSGQVPDEAVISHLALNHGVNSNAAMYKEWNFEKPKLDLTVKEQETDPQKAPVPPGMLLEQYRYPHLYQLRDPGTNYVKLQVLRQLTFARWIECDSDVSRYLPSYTFTLHSHPREDLNTGWWIVAVNHNGEQPGILEHEAPSGRGIYYNSHLVAIPEMTRFIPALEHPKQIVQGQQTAIVTGPKGEEIYPDKYGRVKVQFFWDREGEWDEKTTCWIRVSQGWAGSQFGTMAIPRIGHEVIVSFLEGNPDRPIITGRVYHELNKVPYALPEHKTRTVFKSMSTPGAEGEPRGFNEFRIEDKKGEEEIYVHAEKDVNAYVKNDWKEHILHDRHQTVDNFTYLETKGETHETLRDQRKTELFANDNLTVHATRHEAMDDKWLVKVGDEVHIKVGNKAVIEAGADLTILGGGSFVRCTPGGVTIVGPTVRINSGGSPGTGSGAGPLLPEGTISPPPGVCPFCEQVSPGGVSVSTASPHPVHALSGSKFLTDEPDFTLPGRIPLIWTRVYSSMNSHEGPFGQGWSVPYFMHLVVNRPVLKPEDTPHCLINPQGREIPFLAIKPGHFTLQPSEGLTLSLDHDNIYTLEVGLLFFRFSRCEGSHEQRLHLERIEDRNGNAVFLKYDAQSRLAAIEAADGYTLALEYSEKFPQRISRAYGSLLHEGNADQAGRLLASYGYDHSGRLSSVILADHEVHRAFAYHDSGSGAGLMASHTMASGLRCDYEWGEFPDHPRVVRHGTNDGMVWTSSYEFQPQGGETRVTDSLGYTRTWQWNEKYLPLQYTNAAGESWHLQWNAHSQPVGCILPNGGGYKYAYDGSGRPVGITDPEGGSATFAWDSRYPLLLSFTNKDGGSTLFEYDSKGNRTLTRYPNGGEERFRYADTGDLVERLTPLEGKHRYEWDHGGRLSRYIDCSGHAYTMSYDVYGYPASTTDPLGQTRTMERDVFGRPLVVRHPDGSAEKYAWDKAGRMVAFTDAKGAVTSYRYDSQDQLVEEKDALGGVTSMQYDLAGNMLSLTNPNGESYRFAYDPEGRLLSRTGLDGIGSEYTLDALGLPVHSRHAVGTDLESAVLFERDKLGRIIKGSGDTGITLYRYTPGGKLAQIVKVDQQGRKTSDISRTYDATGAIVEEKSLAALQSGEMAERVLRHEYDLMGNRVRSLLPGGEIVEITPCSSGHVHQINFAAGPDQPEHVISAFERDALNRETLRTQGRICSRRTYDQLSRITRVYTGSLSSQEQLLSLGVPVDTNPLVSKKFSYDVNGELLTSSDVFSGMQQFTYDSLGRITSARRQGSGHTPLTGAPATMPSEPEALLTDETFRYDPASNLYSITSGNLGDAHGEHASSYIMRFDNAPGRAGARHVRHNRLQTIDDIAFFHDTRGRVIEKSCAKTGTRWQYAYDSDNRLVEATAVSSSGSTVTRFAYDALGRRTSKFDGTNETLFVWDGLRLLREECGAIATTYFYEQGGYTPLARVDGKNRFFQGQGTAPSPGQENIYYYHGTPAGLPEDITDNEGRLIWRGRYSTWGKLVHEHTTSHAPRGFSQPLRMQGQYDDGNTGMYYNMFRYYDADSGRFSAEDPIGLAGGDNLYQYAPNPVGWMDPLGWKGESSHIIPWEPGPIISPQLQQEIEDSRGPNPYVAVLADVAGLLGSLVGCPQLRLVAAGASLENDPSFTNSVLNVLSNAPAIGTAVSVGVTVKDTGNALGRMGRDSIRKVTKSILEQEYGYGFGDELEW